MSIFGPEECIHSGKDERRTGATPAYVDIRDSARVSKAGDIMTGDLSMAGNLIRGLPITYPPLYSGDEVTSWAQAVGLVSDAVKSIKSVITVWAEEKGPLNAGLNEWSFGDGAIGFGYVMLAPGSICRMGIACKFKANKSIVTVNITVNGWVHNSYGVTNPIGDRSSTNTFSTPLRVAQGDIINFRSATNAPTHSTCVGLLIELDHISTV
jgi:hypothetical protein